MEKKTGLLFPGQGAQFSGMFKELYDHNPAARAVFDEAEEILHMPIRKLCFEGPDEALFQTENTQICVHVCEIAAWRIALGMGLHPEVFFGFSLGECAALIAAGCLSFAEGLKMVAYRARVMQAAVPLGQGGMLAVIGKEEEAVRRLCNAAGDGLWMANYNCPGQIVCAGQMRAIDRAVAWAGENGYAVKKLDVSIPSHCPMMAPAAQSLADYLQNVPFQDAQTPIIRGETAAPETNGQILRRGIVDQLTHPVRCEDSLRKMLAMGVTRVVEVGPGHVLTGFVRKIDKSVERFCLAQTADLDALEKELA